MDAAFRIIPKKIPTWEQVGLPTELKDLIHHHQGMILVTGPSGCGKTTSLAAFVDLINETKSSHIITIEDPIEYVHGNKASLVSQREVVSHTKSFFSALRAALREDPDVILVGEMRDLETIRMAVTAAETGHLVLSTLHTTSAAGSIDRIVGSFPAEEHSQMRTMVSESLKAIISQVLLPSPDKKQLIPAFEILIVNQAIASLIREGKTFQIPSAQQTGASLGMCLLDQSLLKLVQEKKVDPQAAFARAYKKELIEPFLPNHEQ
jgi:twitching motility protein PilT